MNGLHDITHHFYTKCWILAIIVFSLITIFCGDGLRLILF